MNMNEYQTEALKTAIYPNAGKNPYYPALGLAGEAGEVCNKIKKIMRDQNGLIQPLNRGDIEKELGDALWYIAAVAHEFDLTLNDIAHVNISKLKRRAEHGTLKGSGDDR